LRTAFLAAGFFFAAALRAGAFFFAAGATVHLLVSQCRDELWLEGVSRRIASGLPTTSPIRACDHHAAIVVPRYRLSARMALFPWNRKV
jgi:hypothetical protein